MFSIDTFIKVVPIVLSVPAIFLSLLAFLLQRTIFKKNFLEDNLFDIDCKMITISNIATSEDDTDNGVDKNKKRETESLPDGGYAIHVKDALILEFTLLFSTSGRCCFLDTDISEIRLENSFKKIKITGFTSARVVDNINGFSSQGFTLKTMIFQYVMNKKFFGDDDVFTRVVIESKKIKNGVAVFEVKIHLKDILQNITPGFIFMPTARIPI